MWKGRSGSFRPSRLSPYSALSMLGCVLNFCSLHQCRPFHGGVQGGGITRLAQPGRGCPSGPDTASQSLRRRLQRPRNSELAF